MPWLLTHTWAGMRDAARLSNGGSFLGNMCTYMTCSVSRCRLPRTVFLSMNHVPKSGRDHLSWAYYGALEGANEKLSNCAFITTMSYFLLRKQTVSDILELKPHMRMFFLFTFVRARFHWYTVSSLRTSWWKSRLKTPSKNHITRVAPRSTKIDTVSVLMGSPFPLNEETKSTSPENLMCTHSQVIFVASTL